MGLLPRFPFAAMIGGPTQGRIETGMFEDHRRTATRNAMQVVGAYERWRGARVTDVSAGGDQRLSAAFDRLGIDRPAIPSADYVSTLDEEIRIIEVKGRGSRGPVEALEREVDTLTRAGEHGWLYVVWNATQPSPFELWLVNDPGRLPWELVPPSTRLELKYEAIEAMGRRADLGSVEGLPSKSKA